MWNCRKCWTPIYYKPTPLDRVCDQCLDSTDMSNRSAQARIAELEQMVREYADTCSCVQMMLRDSPVRCILCTKALALLQPEAGKEVVT